MNSALANQMVMYSALRQNCIMPMNEAYQEMTQHTAIIFHVVQILYCIAQYSQYSSNLV